MDVMQIVLIFRTPGDVRLRRPPNKAVEEGEICASLMRESSWGHLD